MDLQKTLTNAGRKISEAQLPHIGSGRQRSMPTYTLDYNAFKWIPSPISGPATWASWFVGEVPALYFADNAIDTVVNGLPNVYNWGVDLYNAEAAKRAANNYFEGAGKRGREQVLRREAENNAQRLAALNQMNIPLNQTFGPSVAAVPNIPAQINAQPQVTPTQQAKRLVTNELKRMSSAGELTKNISRTQKLIDLYKKLK